MRVEVPEHIRPVAQHCFASESTVRVDYEVDAEGGDGPREVWNSRRAWLAAFLEGESAEAGSKCYTLIEAMGDDYGEKGENRF